MKRPSEFATSDMKSCNINSFLFTPCGERRLVGVKNCCFPLQLTLKMNEYFFETVEPKQLKTDFE